MAAAYDLPPDIVHRIMTLAIKERAPESTRLSPLAVCRSWRRVAVSIVYARAYVESSGADCSQSSSTNLEDPAEQSTLKAKSNIELLGNMHFGAVKYLEICDTLEGDGVGFLINIMDAFLLAEADPRSLDMLHDWYYSGNVYDSPGYELHDNFIALAQKLALRVAAILPNATTLYISGYDVCGGFYCCHEYASMFFAKLIDSYTGQLKSLKFHAPDYFPKTSPLPLLQSLDMELVIECYRYWELPKMDPRLLQYMRVSGPKLAHFWYAFTRNNDGVVSFDNLHTLQVWYDNSDNSAYLDSSYAPKEHISDSPLPVLAFPKLEKLVLFFCPEDKLRDWLACPSLKSITYRGLLYDTTWLCKLQLSSLDMLQLEFICFETLDEETVFNMNTLFRRFCGIRTISCKMCLSYSADMAKIDWPHLTHLNMRYIGNMAMLIDVLPMIPDLVCLTVEMNFTQSGQLQESIDALSTLRTRYPVPIKSNVRILIVHAWRCEKFDEFSFAAQNIKLILPNLKSFGVFSTS